MLQAMIQKLVRQAGTRDPFEIARQKHIIITEEPLGSIRGYYSRSHRQPVIHINSALSESQRRFTCAHELGHALLHPKANTPFLHSRTLFSVNRYEIEANRFAVWLLIIDEDLAEYPDRTIPQLAQIFGVTPALMEHRLKGC